MKRVSRVTLLVPVAALALAGCAHNPTVAATVAGQTIPVSDVSVMANFLCASVKAQGSAAQTVPMSQVNEIATTYLVGTKALGDLAERSGTTIPPVSSSGTDELVAALPASQRARAKVIVGEVNSALNFVARQAGGGSQQLIPVLTSVIQSETKAGRLTSNPAYPTVASTDSGSLSTPISAVAQASIAGQPTADYVAALPADQKCG